MNWEILTNSKLIENLGWTLVHSIWQIALVAFVLFLMLRFFKNLTANARYLFSVFALCFAFALPLATFVWQANNAGQNQLTEKAFDAEDFQDTKNKPQLVEKRLLLEEGRLPAAALTEERSAFSFESLQENFKRNLTLALPAIVLLWIFGLGVYTFRLCGGLLHLRRYRTREITKPDAEWQAKFALLCEKLKISQSVGLLRSSLIETPIVVGWFKPVILIPASVFLQMNPQELETILAHELMHIRRYDNLVNFAQSFVEILFFYHPGLWWISASIRREREFACDDAVLKTSENPHLVYASALANLEEIRRLTKKPAPRLAVAASGGKLMQRIERISYKTGERRHSKQSLFLAGLAFLLVSTISISVFSTGTPLLTADTQNSSQRGQKTLAIGFVSIPPVDRMADPPKDSDSTARLMIAKLKEHRIPAIGFVQGGMISDGEKLYPIRAEIVRLWRDAGMEIGVGGYKHIWFYDTPYDEYVANVEKNERVVKQILAEKNLPLRYFSYPFLNTGKTTEDKNRFEAWLQARGLRSIPYTIDNQEWVYSYAYDMARKDNDINTMKQIRAEFVDYMTKMFEHYEAYSQEMFGRDIAQTMVLTPSRLVADSSDELFGMIERRGYKFVSMDEALKDEAYKTPENFTGSKSGISWFERWTLTQGKKLRDEPKVDADVWKLWKEKKSE